MLFRSGTVERALEIFRQLGLVEQLDSGAFYMTDIELMIGQSSTEAERKRGPPVTLDQDVAQKLSRKVLETYLKVLKDGIRDRDG